MNSAWRRLIKKKRKKELTLQYEETEPILNKQALSPDLNENLKTIKEVLGNSSDLMIREFKMGKPSMWKAALLAINGLSDKESIGTFIIERLIGDGDHKQSGGPQQLDQLFTYIKENILTIACLKDVTDWNKLVHSLLSGQTILLIDGLDREFPVVHKVGSYEALRNLRQNFLFGDLKTALLRLLLLILHWFVTGLKVLTYGLKPSNLGKLHKRMFPLYT